MKPLLTSYDSVQEQSELVDEKKTKGDDDEEDGHGHKDCNCWACEKKGGVDLAAQVVKIESNWVVQGKRACFH